MQSGPDPGHWSVQRMREVRRSLARTEFADAARLAEESGARASAEGDRQTWRRFACRHATALYNLGRFTEALAIADAVLASVPPDEHLHTQAHAANIGTIAADRLSRDDTLGRLDAAIALGERIRRERGGVDSLYRTAWTAGTIGLAELGEAIFAELTVDVTGRAESPLPPATIAFLAGQQLVVRNWWALTLEHADDDRAPEVFGRNVETVRKLPELLPFEHLPPKTVAVFRAFEGFALTALGRTAEAGAALSAAEAAAPADPLDIPSTAAALLCAAARLRSGPPADPDTALDAAVRMSRLARRIGDRRGEAELLRLAAVAAARTGDPARIALADEQFATVVERLDWSRRLTSARMTSMRSAALRRVADRVRGEESGDDAVRSVVPDNGDAGRV